MEQTLKQKLDAIVAEGREIKFKWDGGNDSGSYYVLIDDKELEWNTDLYQQIEPIMDRELGYGSFAGDYYTEGELTYSSEEGAFIGSGHDSETMYADVDLEGDDRIIIKIPKDLWFDSLTISSQGYNEWDDFGVSVRLNISNGPVVPKHGEFEDSLKQLLEDKIMFLVEKDTDKEISACFNDWEFNLRDFIKDGQGDMIAYIDSISYGYNDSTNKDFNIAI